MIENLGKLLKEKRLEKKLTMEQAGKLLGVSKVTYRDYELGNIKTMKLDKVNDIANFLDVTPEELFYDKKYEKISRTKFMNEVIPMINNIDNLSEREKKKIKRRNRIYM